MDENISADDAQFLAEVAVESMGWLPLDKGAYLHVGDPASKVVTVVGVPDAEMAGMNVLWME